MKNKVQPQEPAQFHLEFRGAADEFLHLAHLTTANWATFAKRIDSGLSILWVQESETCLMVDGVEYCLTRNQILFLTDLHRVTMRKLSSLRLLQFNRPFYCVVDNDSEVGCKGILFFGASQVPIVKIPKEESDKFETLWKMLRLEMQSHDELQIEMLQTMMKRLVILCTRLMKERAGFTNIDKARLDILRQFNFLVEQHFRRMHSVAHYAKLLHKSPKTLANLFAKFKQKSPLQIIQDRILLEARRQLAYTESPIKEIAYTLGFDSIQSFSRFFKSKEGTSPSEFRAETARGKIANFSGNEA